MRINIDDNDLAKILEILESADKRLYKRLNETISHTVKSNTRDSKKRATKKATQTKIKASKEKIENAKNLLLLENKKITPYSIAKTAGVSYNTVIKYIKTE